MNMYHAIRVGRKRWALGQIGGIFIRSVVLTVVAAVCTILPLLPDIEWSNEWGKLLMTAAMTRALTQFDSSVFIYYEIFSEFSPLQLIGLEILLCVCICTFIGVLMFLLSLFLNKIAAAAGSLALAIALFPVCYPRFRTSASVTDQRAAFATGVLPYIYAFHRYTWSSTLLFCTQVFQFPMHISG